MPTPSNGALSNSADSSRDPLIVRALRGEEVERPPVWLMRQAGRYLIEYRELKEQHSFLGLCLNSELALEVSLQPVRILGVDAAILFSDILLPAAALGIEVDFKPGPVVRNPIRTPSDIAALKLAPFEPLLRAPLETLGMLRERLRPDGNRGVIGFAGSPYTMACYLIDQGPYKGFLGTQVFAKQNKQQFAKLIDLLTELVADYLLAQHEAGADLVQLFDTWGGNLNSEDFRTISLPSMQRIFSRLKKAGCPSILYVNGGGHLLPEMLEAGSDGISIDWRTSLDQARAAAAAAGAENIVIQGNFDPSDLFLETDEVSKKTRAMIARWRGTRGFIVNLGHGVLVQTPRENVVEFVRAAQQGWADNE